jgi:glutamate/aspartate transport system permease protein
MQELDFGVVWTNLPFLWDGMMVSLGLAVLAILGGISLGTVLAVLRLSSVRPVAWVAATYVNALRAVPLILVVFWFYFLVPLLAGAPIGPFWAALTGFVLFETAYYCEIIRAGIQSVPRGQNLAAQASGMARWQAMRYVVLPQAIRKMLPILLTQGVVLFQDTSLVYVVTLHDFLTSTSIIAARESRLVELYSFAAAIYLLICLAASRLVHRLRWSLP